MKDWDKMYRVDKFSFMGIVIGTILSIYGLVNYLNLSFITHILITISLSVASVMTIVLKEDLILTKPVWLRLTIGLVILIIGFVIYIKSP